MACDPKVINSEYPKDEFDYNHSLLHYTHFNTELKQPYRIHKNKTHIRKIQFSYWVLNIPENASRNTDWTHMKSSQLLTLWLIILATDCKEKKKVGDPSKTSIQISPDQQYTVQES